MTTFILSIVFLASLAALCLLALYGLYIWIAEMIKERAWGFLVPVACLLLALASGGTLQIMHSYQQFQESKD